MTTLLAGLLLFFAAHSVRIVAPGWRERVIARLGEMPWKGLYSLVSLAGFALIVAGYSAARAEPTVIYVPPVWLRHVALALLLPVFPLLFATYLPGAIQRGARHPMLLATKLWALAHLLANGMLADLLLFGTFLAWAVADRVSVKRRPRGSGTVPAIHTPANDIIALVAGLALYGAFVAGLHAWLFGVAPLI